MGNKLSKRELAEKKHFDTFADRYDYNYHYTKPFTRYKIDKKSDEFIRLIKSKYHNSDVKILEIGCGTGEYTKRMARGLPKAKIIGLDISGSIIEIAKDKCKKYKNTNFVTKSAYKTGFKENSFDVICGFYVLHHLEILKVRKEMLRILKPGGLIFFCEPNILNPIVFLIKSNKYLKKKIGDSPNEWAINPLTISRHLNEFKLLNLSTTEFIWPLNFVPMSLLTKVDNVTHSLRNYPLVKYLGGSVQIFMQKK